MPTLPDVSDFEVILPAVSQAQRVCADVEAELDGALAQLRSAADEVVAERWRGRAAASFERAWCEWHEAACGVLRDLRLLAETLGQAERAYLLRDDAQAGEFRLVLT